MLLLTIAKAFAILGLCGTALSTLIVTPYMHTATKGENVQFTCSDIENDTLKTTLKWAVGTTENKNVSYQAVPELGRVSAVNGVLVISNVTQADATTYTCWGEGVGNNQTGVLVFYIMPDYVREGIIIGAICFGLLVMLVVGTIFFKVKERQKKPQKYTYLSRKNGTVAI